MVWNWQQPAWPEFSWNSGRLSKAEDRFLVGTGIFVGSLEHLAASDQQKLTIDALSAEAVTTSEIEGEILDRASVQSSIRWQFGLAPDDRRVAPAERGISQMLVDLNRSFAESLSDETLCSWHRMLFSGRGGVTGIGRYRASAEPMEVVSGPIHAPRVHFVAPPSFQVPEEMARFVKWFNGTAPESSDPLPALTRAGIAHL